MNRNSTRFLILLAEIFGGGSLVLFALFLFVGPRISVRLQFTERGPLYWDALLSLAFFAQHSLMVRSWFKDWLALRVPRDFHAAIYATASGVVLAAVMLLWQASSLTLIELPDGYRWLARALAVLAIAGFAWSAHALRIFDLFGQRAIAARLRGTVAPVSELVVRGPYRWVRHPLTFFMMVLIWTAPDVTADRALFNVLWTTWMVIGSHFEERDLVAEFGAQYRAYQSIVPMLLPWRGPAGKRLAQPN